MCRVCGCFRGGIVVMDVFVRLYSVLDTVVISGEDIWL